MTSNSGGFSYDEWYEFYGKAFSVRNYWHFLRHSITIVAVPEQIGTSFTEMFATNDRLEAFSVLY
jgi:hypothetical protein